MFVSTDVYLKRLTNTLEKLIAPEIEDDFARGQVFAVIDLINQLSGRIEYKRDMIEQDITGGVGMIKKILEAVKNGGGGEDTGLEEFVRSVESGEQAVGLPLRAATEEKVCEAIAYLHENKAKMDPAGYAAIDQELRDFITKTTIRDLGMSRPPLIEKISRSQREKKT